MDTNKKRTKIFLRKYWFPLSVFIAAIAVVCAYMIQTQPPKEPMKIYKAVKPIEKPTQQPTTAQTPVGETSQNGHFHADNTWHEGPHETPPTPPVEAPPQLDPLETFSEEEQQRAIAQMLESLPEKLELEKANRDILKRGYEDALRQLKHFEEMNAQRERNFYDTSRIKERIAEVKAKLDMQESVISHLEKWRDEHANK